MIVDHLRKIYGEDEIPSYLISKIAKKMKTDAKNGGQTMIDNVPLVNDLFVTKHFKIKFIPKYPCDWRTVEAENNKYNPVIAWIWTTDKKDPTIGTGHSVVVTNVDPEGIVEFNDPARGEQKLDTVRFISQWENENVNKTLILVEVEKRNQTELPEFNPIKEEQTVECTTND